MKNAKITLQVICVLILCIAATPTVYGQSSGTGDEGKNLLKFKATALLLNNYAFQYERMVSPKISVSLSARFMPKGGVPMLGSFESIIDDPRTFNDLEKLKIGGSSFTPEVRFYLGNNEGPRGFYVAPYLSYTTYNATFEDFEFTVEETVQGQTYTETERIDLNGNIRGISGGVLLGIQWKLTDLLYLDWWFLGASYGGSSGDMEARTDRTLDAEWQRALKERVDELSIPLVNIESTVHQNGLDAKIKGPWAGVKSGLSLAFRF